MIKMRVKWKEYISFPTYAQDEMLETGLRPEDTARDFEGVVVESARSSFSGWHFLVLLDNGEFRDVLATQCEVVDKDSLKPEI